MYARHGRRTGYRRVRGRQRRDRERGRPGSDRRPRHHGRRSDRQSRRPTNRAERCEIVLPDGKRVKAKTLGVNSDIDSGMVKITDKGPNDGKWPFMPVAKSADLKKGQWVVSLGHPGGPKTADRLSRGSGALQTNDKEIVQSNCTLVGGDSGGPLFDLDGNVVGIHSRIGLTLAQNIHVPTELFKNQWDKLVAGEVFGERREEDRQRRSSASSSRRTRKTTPG